MDEKQKVNDPNLEPREVQDAQNVTLEPTTGTTVTPEETVTTSEGIVDNEVPAATSDQFDSNEHEYTESSMLPMVVGAIILALAAIAAVWFFSGSNSNVDDLAAQVGSALALDTEGDPDDVMATVNGVDLTRAEYNRIRQQVLQNAQMMGMDINDPETQIQINAQVTDTLVNTELIRQAAVASGTTVSEGAVSDRFAEIVAQVGGEEVLADSLEQLGLTEESLRADVEQELIIQQYIDGAIDTDNLTVTEAEIEGLYESSGGAEAGLPPLEEVRLQIEQQILINKENELINDLIELLRADAEIEV